MSYSVEYKLYIKALVDAIRTQVGTSSSDGWTLSKSYQELLKLDSGLMYRGSVIADEKIILTADSIAIEDEEILNNIANHIKESRNGTGAELGQLSVFQMAQIVLNLSEASGVTTYGGSADADSTYIVEYNSSLPITVIIDGPATWDDEDIEVFPGDEKIIQREGANPNGAGTYTAYYRITVSEVTEGSVQINVYISISYTGYISLDEMSSNGSTATIDDIQEWSVSTTLYNTWEE